MIPQNDNWLIYLYKSENSEVALKALFEKYDRFIYKTIYSFYVPQIEVEDFHQEGLIVLMRAINSYNENYTKTFMRYFELILQREIIKQKNKLHHDLHFDFIEEMESIIPLYYDQDILDISFKNPIEQFVYEQYFINGITLENIQKEKNLNKKQIYNIMYKIKEKLRNV